MKKYLMIANLAFQRLAVYRFNFFMRIVINFIAYSATFAFWLSMANSGMDVKPYTSNSLAVYFFLIGIMSTVVGFPSVVVADEIRYGRIGSQVVKPFNYLLYKYFTTIPDKTMMLSLATVVIGSVLSLGLINVSITPANIFVFAVALFVASVGNFLVYFIAGITAFWLKHIYGVQALVSVVSNLISGSAIPLELLPATLLMVSKYLPFRYFHFFPVQIFLGHAGFRDILEGFTIEIIWVIALYILYGFLWKKGMKQLEVIGT